VPLQEIEPADVASAGFGSESGTTSRSGSGSSRSIDATPSSSSGLTSAEEALWHDFVSFVLHKSGIVCSPRSDTPVSLEQIHAAIERGELDIPAALASLDEDLVADLYVQFMRDNRDRVRKFKAPSDGPGNMQTVD
jgi:hypothetical protein